jgi:hypothetical protein
MAVFINGFIRDGLTGGLVLYPVGQPVGPGEFAFREQLRLGLQPMLHRVSLWRTLVDITEVGPSGHFVR